ncbi:hypothetical protein BKA65DRAFT_25926 [Rhexocercosporidium sp. MPI-PUGE-AT-0058]|nr:hypothetical protein BKA65DRAFT_25926 [Rhexocercosporidium sp. MPI-PUGE-AT-0058]
MSSQRTPRTLVIDVGKPLRSIHRLVAIPISTFYRITKLDSVFVFSRHEMAGSRDFEESAGLLANDDLYDDDSNSSTHPTPEEHESPDLRPHSSKVILPAKNPAVQHSRAINTLTKISLCISALGFLVLITALIIVPAGKFSGPQSWRSGTNHHTTGETAIGLTILSITTLFCFLSSLRNVRKPMPVALSAFIDLMLVSILFPMAIYAVTIGYPSQNWCIYYNKCLGLVKGEKILIIIGTVFGFILSFIHLALLILRPWRRPSNMKFSIFQFDFNITITKRFRHHSCNCCAQLAASRRAARPSPPTSVPIYPVGEGRCVDL